VVKRRVEVIIDKAELVGVTRKTINTIENGKFVPSTILAIKLARVKQD
jgi:putative transcriptional regulator